MIPEDLMRIMNSGEPKSQTECLKCSRCCARVLPMQPSELEAAVKYLIEHPELLEKMKAIRKEVSSSFFCPFLDLTTDKDERCIIYNTPIKFKVCSLFQCWGDGNDEAIHEWVLSCLSTEDDLVIMVDLLHMICGDPEDKAPKFDEALAKLYRGTS